jgi:hypothetical protein
VRRLGWLVLLAGCDHLLQLEDIKPPPPCSANPNVIADRFDETTACKPWASVFTSGNATLVEAGQHVTISVDPAASSQAGCSGDAPSPLDAMGTFISVDQAVTGASAYTSLALVDVQDLNSAITIAMTGGVLALQNFDGSQHFGPGVAYIADSMRFWRIRMEGSDAVGEFSPDAVHWTTLASTAGMASVPDRVYVSFGAGGPGVGTAVFSHLNVCP